MKRTGSNTLLIIGTCLLFLQLTGANSLPAQGFSNLSFGTDSTFEVLTWNVERFPKKGQTTINYVSQIIKALDVDLLAIQEVSDTTLFKQMVNGLDGYNGYFKSGWFAGLAYIYKTGVIDVHRIYEIYTTSPYWSAFPRSPMVMEMSFMGHDYIIINNHFKCCGDGIFDRDNPNDEESRRYKAATLLKQHIDYRLPDKRVILLGDLNDIITDSRAHNVFQDFIDDTTNYRFADMSIAQGNKSEWSFPTWPSHLDHILITNELFDEFENNGSDIQTIKLDQYMTGGWSAYDRNITDHRPVALKLKPNQPTGVKTSSTPTTINICNYPNPFNNVTQIVFDPVWENSELYIYNIKGELVELIPIAAGQSSVQWTAGEYANGVYFVRLLTDGAFTAFNKITLAK